MICPSHDLSCIWFVLHMICLAYDLSSIGFVHHMICPAYNLSCIWFVLYIICPVYCLSTYDLSSIWFVLHKICSDMIGPHHVMRIIFPSNDLSYISCRFYMCHTNLLSYIRFVPRIMPNNELGKYLCHNIFLKKHITIFLIIPFSLLY